jgi:hypothetical protein
MISPFTLPSAASATVPEDLIGCWERLSIRFADGSEDKTTRVIWLQTLSGVADIRIPDSRPDLQARAGFADCSRDELLDLAEQDCFCGITLFDPEAEPFPTAHWPKEAYLFRFQPVITFPEPGWLAWQECGTHMIEKAPSGAYEEHWQFLPASRSFAAHLARRDAAPTTRLYIAGEHAIYARNRAMTFPSHKTLVELARDARDDRDRLATLLDCEFSYARRDPPGDDYTILASTLPWREGAALDYPWLPELAAKANDLKGLALGDDWTVESFGAHDIPRRARGEWGRPARATAPLLLISRTHQRPASTHRQGRHP